MIKLVTELGFSHTLKPTIFPDGTSQVWKLPYEILASKELEITWHFEAEREIIDLVSLRFLLPSDKYTWLLHIPFLPYARQDKNVDNALTFNLRVLAYFINQLWCEEVTAVDAHNPKLTAELIFKFKNIKVTQILTHLIKNKQFDYVVFPDQGAALRYREALKDTEAVIVVCDKKRDQLTGNILSHEIVSITGEPARSNAPYNYLIVDDLCDGGATFISVAKMLRRDFEGGITNVDLYVTHGIFSKGREHLLTNGINNIYTTNSLLKNEDGYQV